MNGTSKKESFKIAVRRLRENGYSFNQINKIINGMDDKEKMAAMMEMKDEGHQFTDKELGKKDASEIVRDAIVLLYGAGISFYKISVLLRGSQNYKRNIKKAYLRAKGRFDNKTQREIK